MIFDMQGLEAIRKVREELSCGLDGNIAVLDRVEDVYKRARLLEEAIEKRDRGYCYDYH